MSSTRAGGWGLWCGAAMLAAAAAAQAQPDPGPLMPKPGHCVGTWTNTTFATMGSISADLDRSADGSFVLDRITIGGNVFGVGNVQPLTWTWHWNSGASNWTGSLTGHPVFGDVSGTMAAGGGFMMTGSNVPSAFVTSYTAMGNESPETLDATGHIILTGGTADTVIHMARTAVSRLKSATQTAGGRYGFAVAASAPAIVDGAGVQIAVGAPMESPGGISHAGRVYVYEAFTEELMFTLQSVGAVADGFFGYSVASVPDVNGDGVSDWIVGAPGEHPGTNPVGTGRAYVYSGATGALLFRLIPPTPSLGMGFGTAVGGIPDVNGDGHGDFVVGAPNETVSGLAHAGHVYIYSGMTRLRTIASPAPAANNYFGASVAGLSDINADLHGDIVVGQPENSAGAAATGRPGHAYAFSGATGATLRTFISTAAIANGFFGNSVSGVADVNADGVMDIVVGAPWEHPGASPSNCGRAHVFSGASGALLYKLQPPTPVANGNFGFAVAGSPDLNADGHGDIIVGAPGEPGNGAGRVHVYSGISGVRITTLAPLYPDVNGHFGSAVAAMPDYTGNGRAEVFVGAPQENPSGTPTDCGRAYINRR